MEIKAIETYWNGWRFRSRTEARWAVFFKTLNLKWDYEIEGYEFDDGTRYLPDFLIERMCDSKKKVWVEIKGTYPNDKEIQKMRNLIIKTRRLGYFFIGVPGNHEIYECCFEFPPENCMEILSNNHKPFRKVFYLKERPPERGRKLSPDFMAVDRAIEESRSARFEFGEKP